MLLAILELLIAPLAILAAIIWLGRQAQRWHSLWVWSRYVRAARVHNRSGRFLDDRPPLLKGEAVVDAEFEVIGGKG
jgi:hypothetical protein